LRALSVTALLDAVDVAILSHLLEPDTWMPAHPFLESAAMDRIVVGSSQQDAIRLNERVLNAPNDFPSGAPQASA
jgi:hypothetical protein